MCMDGLIQKNAQTAEPIWLKLCVGPGITFAY